MNPGAIPDVDDLVKSAVKTIFLASGQGRDMRRVTYSIMTRRAIFRKCCRTFGVKLLFLLAFLDSTLA